VKNDFIKSPLNYTGGKTKLLPQIYPLFPKEIETFVDMFCGGANVGINVHANRIIYNDINKYLIGLFRVLKKYDYDAIKTKIEKIINEYGLSDSTSKGYSYYSCESGAGLGSYNKEPYIELRKAFNSKNKIDDGYYLYLFTLIVYCFNNQIRFNRKGEFNLPVGKRDFNSNIKENLRRFVKALHSQKCDFLMEDFRNIAIDDLREGDFVYCDPPYLITTASYNESNGWQPTDDSALLNYLDKLNCHKIKFALSNVIRHKGKTNHVLIHWAKKYNMHILNFNYNNSSYHGKSKDEITEEVLITNY
jgi:DNA adenine methylase Dam